MTLLMRTDIIHVPCTVNTVMCRFSSFVLGDDYYARLLSAVTGMDYEPQDLHLIGERIWNLEKLYNVREGFGPEDDTLPARFLSDPLRDTVVNLPPMLDEYRRFRGWNAAGVPTPEKIERLGLQSLHHLLDAGELRSGPVPSSSG